MMTMTSRKPIHASSLAEHARDIDSGLTPAQIRDWTTRECLRSLRRLIYHTKQRIAHLGKAHPMRWKLLADLDQLYAEYAEQKLCLYTLS